MNIQTPEELLKAWPTLRPEEQERCVRILQASRSALYWAQHCTKTLDEQDRDHPYKPFPKKSYFNDLYAAWNGEPVLMVEKSRTMMASWSAAAFALHAMMTVPATRVIFTAIDEDRSLKALNYAWILWENQDDELKKLWPLDRPREKQSFNVLELKNASSAIALPGKDVDKIRSEHPTIVIFDEAAFIERFGRALDNALATRALKIMAVTSAEPGDFREYTRDAVDTPWPYGEQTKGVTLRRIPEGKPGVGVAVLRLHYSADPDLSEERLTKLRTTYTTVAGWEKEMEIAYESFEGNLMFPEYRGEVNDVVPFDVSDPSHWSIWMACDPHMRTPHAFMWEAFSSEGESVVCGEMHPGQQYTVREYAECIDWIESDSRTKPEAFSWANGKPLRIIKRFMDTHGTAANSDEGADFFAAYRKYGLQFYPAAKSSQALAAARDRIGEAMLPTAIMVGDEVQRVPRRRVFTTCHGYRRELMNVRYPSGDIERSGQERPKTYAKHRIDSCNYIWTARPSYVAPVPTLYDEFVPINPNVGY